MLFDPGWNLVGTRARHLLTARGPLADRGGFDALSGLYVIAGDVAVGQVCCDPVTFAEVTVRGDHAGPLPSGDDSAGALMLGTRARALLRMVYPRSVDQARALWSGRVAARFRREVAALGRSVAGPPGAVPAVEDLPGRVDGLVTAVVADVTGLPAAVLRRVVARSRAIPRCQALARCRHAGPGEATGPSCAGAVARAAAPMALLRREAAGVVRDRAAAALDRPGEGEPETVLDELLLWRGLDRDDPSPDEVAALLSALAASMWDATQSVLSRLVTAVVAVAGSDRSAWTRLAADAAARAELVGVAVRDGPGAIAWLRVTTQAALLGGARIPAGARCVLVVDAAVRGDRPVRPTLEALRWLAPAAPHGAGATFARVAADELLAALAGSYAHPARAGVRPSGPLGWHRLSEPRRAAAGALTAPRPGARQPSRVDTGAADPAA